MSAEKNKALVRCFLEAQAKADLDAIDELLAPDFVDHSLVPGQEPDREGYKRAVAADHAALSDLRFIIEDQVAAGDEVATRFTTRSVHDRGKLGMGVAPTGQERVSTGIFIHRIVEGKIADEWGASRVAWHGRWSTFSKKKPASASASSRSY